MVSEIIFEVSNLSFSSRFVPDQDDFLAIYQLPPYFWTLKLHESENTYSEAPLSSESVKIESGTSKDVSGDPKNIEFGPSGPEIGARERIGGRTGRPPPAASRGGARANRRVRAQNRDLRPSLVKEEKVGDPTSSKIPSEDRPTQRSEVPKRTQKAPKADDVISTVTEDSFISFRKKFHFPNDLVMKVPARTDRACFPPLDILRAGLRFPPSSEPIDILTLCGVCLSQFSYRAMSIVMGLIVLFRDRRVVLSSECLSRMGGLFNDAQGRISFRSKWLDIRTRDPRKNDWGLQEKWGKLKELPVPLHIGAEDLLRILKLPDLDALHYEVRYLSRYVNEEYLFKVGLSTLAGRSHAQMLKKSARVPEVAQATIKQQEKAQQVLEAENERLQSVLSEKEAQQLPSAVTEEFKKSYAFKIIIEDHIQEARSHIYDVEVKALEAECAEDGFIRGFMKGVRTVHRKTGAEIEGLTPSQASGDASSDSGGEELESELQRAFEIL
ncbi:hypothetical protein IEQ34_018769 [Dendrobium chrysotoxum]|uniref:Uncharacterized protein n=1 Tax=Dendrobium chrysotoxum TaxID=161865 RepID=A0AAV7FPC3_DENCH|nr:hypothetical protein IEQ34_018769 [Dendrobium chrysotoxum]